MGTEYGFGEVGTPRVRLYSYEMSGVFSLYADLPSEQMRVVRDEVTDPDGPQVGGTYQITLVDQVTPAQLVSMAAEMIKTASYWGEAGELKPLLKDLKQAAPELFK
jgi:hypothetical protein